MPATPISNPVSGETLVGIEPQLLQQVDPGWRRRLNLFTGRALTDTALDNEQAYRAGLLATLGQSVTAGTVKGLSLSLDTSGATPNLVVTPGYGITAGGQDVVLNQTLKTSLAGVSVVDPASGVPTLLTIQQFMSNPANTNLAGILLLLPVVAQVSGQTLDTGTPPIIVSGNLGASCGQDPAEYAFEDWQIADALQLVYMAWPVGVANLPLPAQAPAATWRNRLAYTIFEAESLLGPDDQLPWAMLGVPVGLIAFDTGTVLKPLFIDCSSVVRAGGLPRDRYVIPSQPEPLVAWLQNTAFALGDFIVDPSGNIQKVQTAGTSGPSAPTWNATFGQITKDGPALAWINNGPSQWQANKPFAAGQFIYDPNGYLQFVAVAGTSGLKEPIWNGVYLPTTDNGVTWVNNGAGTPPVVQSALAQARINQLSEQLSQTIASGAAVQQLTDYFTTLPPSGILPATSMDFVNHRATWLPRNWTVTAAPVRLEELETVLETGMREALLAAEATAPTDPTQMEPVEVLVPLPDAVYDPDILVVESVAPVFQQEVNNALAARNLTLQQMETAQEQINVLLTGIGPNQPATAGLIDPNAGLTQQELAGRNTYPPFLPGSGQDFGTSLPTTWIAGTSYAIGAIVIDTNSAIQVLISAGPAPSATAAAPNAGTAGSGTPAWSQSVAGTTPDGPLTWLNNGPWSWQPNTAYVAGQFVVDATGVRHSVTVAGTSASVQPAWSDAAGANTLDGILWQPQGAAKWQADTLYAQGALIFDSRGNIQIAQTGGISDDSQPASWNPNPGQTTQDGGVTWNNLGNSKWQAGTKYSAGQAIIDGNGDIQTVLVGGTSGAKAPAWVETAGQSTTDAAVTWNNAGPITWQANFKYLAGTIIVDANGNLQSVQTPGQSGQGPKPPAWSTASGSKTTDNGVTWICLQFVSSDIQQLLATAAQAPYTATYKDSTGAAQTLALLSAADLALLGNGGDGLVPLIASLQARVLSANDILDTGFLTVQTDIYRYRESVLGTNFASVLATSPVLASIATGDTAAATSTNLQSYISSVLPPPSATLPKPAPVPVSASERFTPQMASFHALPAPTPAGHLRPEPAPAPVPPHAPTFSEEVPRAQIIEKTLNRASTPNSVFTGVAAQRAGVNLNSGIFNIGRQLPPRPAPPAAVVVPGQTAPATSNDITSQSPIPGAQLNLRTLTIAERLALPPSQEAMFYSISNRLNFLQALQTLCTDLNIVADDLPLLVDGPVSTTPSTSSAPVAVPVLAYTFKEWLSNPTKQLAIQTSIQSPNIAADAAEATLFSVGVRVVEQHTMLLRALEARVQQYSDFLTLCNTTLSNMQGDIQQAQANVSHLSNNLQQQRQNVAFTTALLSDETNRVDGVNALRKQILANSVQLVAYTRARTLEATETVPSRQLVPANVTNPVPACLQQTVSIPPELREIVGQLREAPVNWLPSASSLLNKLESPSLLQELALSVQARAALQLQTPLLPSSAIGEPRVYASTIANVYTANQQVFRSFQVQRAAIQPSALKNLSWSLQVASVQSIAAINDVISSQAVHAEISNAVARLIQQISSVATCLYTRVSIALPVDRLAWAEFLRGAGASAGLSSLSVLPNWNQQAYTDRQQMQMLVDWLFLQIDTTITAAAAYMSDVVRTAILLASDVPIDNVLSGNILNRIQPAIGGVVSLTLPSNRVTSGMYVQLYSGVDLAARAVVTDLDSTTVSATVTDVFKKNVYLETTDAAHFTAQTPQAVALRALFS